MKLVTALVFPTTRLTCFMTQIFKFSLGTRSKLLSVIFDRFNLRVKKKQTKNLRDSLFLKQGRLVSCEGLRACYCQVTELGIITTDELVLW